MIDISFNVSLDTKLNKDPDTFSRTLNDYHHFLWEKPLPNGSCFSLEQNDTPPYYLRYLKGHKQIKLSSDIITHTYSKRKETQKFIQDIDPVKFRTFYNLAFTIGGYIIFPAEKINHRPTINIIRGLHPYINDRFDLTLECIRRWYINEPSPLFMHLDRYRSFFELFVDFKGYVDFFLLQDLVNPDGSIHFWRPFEAFNKDVIPQTKEDYLNYMHIVSQFISKRNEKILEFSRSKTTSK